MSLNPQKFYSKKKSDFVAVFPLNNIDSEHESTDDEDANKCSSKNASHKKKKVLGTAEEADGDTLSDYSSPRWPRSGVADSSIVIPPTDSEESASSLAAAKPIGKKKRITQIVFSKRFNERPKHNVHQVAPKPKPLAARNIFQHQSKPEAPKVSWVPSSRSASLVKAAVGLTHDPRLAAVNPSNKENHSIPEKTPDPAKSQNRKHVSRILRFQSSTPISESTVIFSPGLSPVTPCGAECKSKSESTTKSPAKKLLEASEAIQSLVDLSTKGKNLHAIKAAVGSGGTSAIRSLIPIAGTGLCSQDANDNCSLYIPLDVARSVSPLEVPYASDERDTPASPEIRQEGNKFARNIPKTSIGTGPVSPFRTPTKKNGNALGQPPTRKSARLAASSSTKLGHTNASNTQAAGSSESPDDAESFMKLLPSMHHELCARVLDWNYLCANKLSPNSLEANPESEPSDETQDFVLPSPPQVGPDASFEYNLTPVTPETDNTFDPAPSPDDTDVPLFQRIQARLPDRPKWITGDIPEKVFGTDPDFTVPDELKSPAEYFKIFFDKPIVDYIVEQTNLYSMQCDGKSMNVTSQEIYSFFSIMIFMGVCSLPAIEDYWASRTRISQVADLLSYKRFQQIRSKIHFQDNSEPRGADPWLKMRPILNKIRDRCQSLEQEIQLSIDECMVGYKGTYAGQLRQYMPQKPSSKWGFKLFVLAGASGITYDFIPYCGSYTFLEAPLTEEEKHLGVGASAVIALCRSIRSPATSTVTFDNWYSGVPLVTYLKKEMGIYSLGTIKPNRLDKCPFLSDKEFKRLPRGSSQSKINEDGVILIKWLDSKPIHVVSTYVGVRPEGEVLRYIKEAKGKVQVPCPKAIKVYNSTMGGVDLSDMLMSLHSIPAKSSRRYYFPMVGYLLDMCATNAWLLYKRDCKLIGVDQELKSSKEFRIHVSCGLAVGCQQKRGRPSLDNSLSKSRIKEPKPTTPRPVDDLRMDGLEHWPQYSDKGRCRYCSMLTRMMCSKCKCRLCLLEGRNCFVQFHIQKT